MSSSSHNKLPSLRPEDGSPRGSEDTRSNEGTRASETTRGSEDTRGNEGTRASEVTRVGQLRPSALKLEPRLVTRAKGSQHEARETCEHCDEIPQTLHEAFLAREEARLAREEARLIRDEARLAQIRAQTEIRKESRQIREEMYRICAEIYQLKQSKINEVRKLMSYLYFISNT